MHEHDGESYEMMFDLLYGMCITSCERCNSTPVLRTTQHSPIGEHEEPARPPWKISGSTAATTRGARSVIVIKYPILVQIQQTTFTYMTTNVNHRTDKEQWQSLEARNHIVQAIR